MAPTLKHFIFEPALLAIPGEDFEARESSVVGEKRNREICQS
jgi:hypothetical protein